MGEFLINSLTPQKIMKKGKNYKQSVEQIENLNEAYSIEEVLEKLEKMPKAKFDESVEVHIKLKTDPKKGDQQIRGVVDLPHGTGKTKRIAAVTSSAQKEAKEAGADIVAGEEIVVDILAGKIDFDVLVTTPEMMPKLAKAAKVLGPRGLMPNPKSQTVGPKIGEIIEGLKKGRASFKSDKGANVHQVIGKRSFKKEHLRENFQVFMNILEKSKPEAFKGKLIENISISATMTPGIKVKF